MAIMHSSRLKIFNLRISLRTLGIVIINKEIFDKFEKFPNLQKTKKKYLDSLEKVNLKHEKVQENPTITFLSSRYTVRSHQKEVAITIANFGKH